MGVAQYIIRRACGRGAYDPILDNATTEISVPARSSDGSYFQRYDARGRPENRISRTIKADQIHAKNAVLETVGVVERRRKTVNTRSSGTIGLQTLGKWDIIRSTPNMVGLFVRTVLNGWTYRLQACFLLGTLDCSLPFSEVVLSELSRTNMAGLVSQSLAASAIRALEITAMSHLAPGIVRIGFKLVPRSLLEMFTFEQSSDTWLALFCVRVLSGVMLSATLLIPLTIYADLIAVGIYPGYLPPWRALLLHDRFSPYQWAKMSNQPLRSVLGPAILYSTVQHLRGIWEDDDDVNVDDVDDVDDDNFDDAAAKLHHKATGEKSDFFHLFVSRSVATWRFWLYQNLGWNNRLDGREHFEYSVYSLVSNPYNILRLVRAEIPSWPLKGMYLRSVCAAIPTTMGLLGWKIGTVHEYCPFETLSKAGLCAAMALLVDVGVWTTLWGVTRLIGVERSI